MTIRDIPPKLRAQWSRDRLASARTLRKCTKARVIEFALDYRDGWLAAIYLLGEKADAQVPTTWLDPLLSGPNAIPGLGRCDASVIEALLRAVKQRIAAITKEET